MVIDLCTLDIQPCAMHFCVRSNTLIKMVYNTFLCDKCTLNHNHICNHLKIHILHAVLQRYQLRRSDVVMKGLTKSGFFLHKNLLNISKLDGYTARQQKNVNKTENRKGHQNPSVVWSICQNTVGKYLIVTLSTC